MLRRPLGRGLDALIETNEPPPQLAPPSAAGGPTLTTLALDQIVPGPFQPRRRFDPERLQELTDAIRSQGVVEPLVVRPAPAAGADGARFELIAGERRLRAARNAALTEVPVVIRDLDDRGALEMSLVENLAREDLTAIEEARAFRRLLAEFGLVHEDIAARIGKSRPYVSNAMRLLELPESVIEMVDNGALSAGQARPLLGLASAEAQVAAAREIAEGRVSARGAEQLVRAHRRRKSQSARPTDANLSALEETLQRALMRKVRVIRRRGRTPGRIEIEYYDDNDLNALADTLAGRARSDSALPP